MHYREESELSLLSGAYLPLTSFNCFGQVEKGKERRPGANEQKKGRKKLAFITVRRRGLLPVTANDMTKAVRGSLKTQRIVCPPVIGLFGAKTKPCIPGQKLYFPILRRDAQSS